MRAQTVTVTGTGGTSLVSPTDLYTPYSAIAIQVTCSGTAGTATVQNSAGNMYGADSGTAQVWGTSDMPAALVSFTGTQAYGAISNQGYTGFRLTVTGADAAAVYTMRMSLTGLV